MKRSFFQAAVVSILLYGCTSWMLTKRMEKKLDGNYTKMLRAILNKSGGQQPTKQQLYCHQPPITKTIRVRRTRYMGHCWRSRDELISGVFLWTPLHGLAKAGQPARTYIQQLCADTRCCSEDLPEAKDDREGWRERFRDICADGATWWFCSYIRVYFQLVTFVRKLIWHKALLMGYSMRLELIRVCSLNGFQLVMGLYEGHTSLFLRVCLP